MRWKISRASKIPFKFFCAPRSWMQNSEASKPDANTLDLNSSQCTDAMGTGISFFNFSTKLSTSYPIMPDTHDVPINMAFGLYLSYTFFVISPRLSEAPNTVSFSFISVPTNTVLLIIPLLAAIAVHTTWWSMVYYSHIFYAW